MTLEREKIAFATDLKKHMPLTKSDQFLPKPSI